MESVNRAIFVLQLYFVNWNISSSTDHNNDITLPFVCEFVFSYEVNVPQEHSVSHFQG